MDGRAKLYFQHFRTHLRQTPNTNPKNTKVFLKITAKFKRYNFKTSIFREFRVYFQALESYQTDPETGPSKIFGSLTEIHEISTIFLAAFLCNKEDKCLLQQIV